MIWRLNLCWIQELFAQSLITEPFGKLRELGELRHPITIQKSTKVTKTYSLQTVPMIAYAIITFSYDPDGQYIFPLTVWIAETRTQNFLGLDSCQKQVCGIHFDLPGIELRNPPKSLCYGSFHLNKPYLHLITNFNY